MDIRVKKINGEEYTTKTEKDILEIYKELSDMSGNNFILLGEHIEQKMTIESIIKE
jgi:hypothetical protein